jgi:hypothetical protein
MQSDGVKHKKSRYRVGDYDITIESFVNDDSRLHDYGVRRSAWYRGVRLMKRLGSARALDLIEERADRALARGDVAMCCRWRDFIVVIHAIEADETLPTDRVH